MANPGFIYVLINQTMEGCVKIGKTSRSPVERAKELSAATGVPTPFMVAYDAFFNDCEKAEEFVHLLLEKKGYRISGNKEFFNAPLREVIDSIHEAVQLFETIKTQVNEEIDNSAFSVEDNETRSWNNRKNWIDVYNQAQAYYEGTGETLQDYSEALKLFKQSITLGCIWAYEWVAQMCEFGQGCRKNNNDALRFYNEAAKRGLSYCYTYMARIYLASGHMENMEKCWKLYFDNTDFASLGNDVKRKHALCCLNYFDTYKKHGLLSTYVVRTAALKHEILELAAERLSKAKEASNHDLTRYFERIFSKIEQGTLGHETFNTGDRVKVFNVPFVGFNGSVTNIDTDRQRVTVRIDLGFGTPPSIELSFMDVEKIDY